MLYCNHKEPILRALFLEPRPNRMVCTLNKFPIPFLFRSREEKHGNTALFTRQHHETFHPFWTEANIRHLAFHCLVCERSFMVSDVRLMEADAGLDRVQCFVNDLWHRFRLWKHFKTGQVICIIDDLGTGLEQITHTPTCCCIITKAPNVC